MKVSAAYLLGFVAALASSNGLADAQDIAGNTTEVAYNPKDVVQQIALGTNPLAPVQRRGPGDPSLEMPVVTNPFLETINVRRPYDNLIVTSPDVAQHEIVRVKDGSIDAGHLYINAVYGQFLIFRVRTITKGRVRSIRADPLEDATHLITLSHTMSNTQATQLARTESWELEATVTARAEAGLEAFGFPVSVSTELSSTVRSSVSTTYSASASQTITISEVDNFALHAPAGKMATLWVLQTTLDIYTCKTPQLVYGGLTISEDKCRFSHSVTESGKQFEITITD